MSLAYYQAEIANKLGDLLTCAPETFADFGQLKSAIHPAGWRKYLTDYKEYIKIAYDRTLFLKLDILPRKRILDLATGMGYFPYIASNVHEIACTEVNTTKVYRKAHTLLGLKAQYFRILPSTLLPIEGQFDIITAFDVCFDYKWTFKDYTFFFDDILSHLTSDGKAYFRLLHRPDNEKCRALFDKGPIGEKIYFVQCR